MPIRRFPAGLSRCLLWAAFSLLLGACNDARLNGTDPSVEAPSPTAPAAVRHFSSDKMHAARMPVNVRHHLDGPAILSVPVTLTLFFDVPPRSSVELVLFADPGLMVEGDMVYTFSNDTDDAVAKTLPLRVSGTKAGKHYLGVTAVLARDERTVSGSVSIPVAVQP